MKKYLNDLSPFAKSLDEIEDHIVAFGGHDRPRYIYPDNNEAGYLGIDNWGQYWNKALFTEETVGKLSPTKYYSIIVVPVKTDISVGGLPIYGEATPPSTPQLPSAGLRGFNYTIPTHEQSVVRDTGISFIAGSGTVTDDNQDWVVDEHKGRTVKNVETGEEAEITANTATELTATGFSIAQASRYQILTITVKARLIYAAEMTSAAEVFTSSYYLAGVVRDNTSPTYTLTSYVAGADIWDFNAGYFPPPNAASCKNVSSILFCGGGITEQRGLAKYDGTIEAKEAATFTAPIITGTGEGTATLLVSGEDAITEDWTLECTAGGAGATFTVVGSVTPAQATLTSAVGYSNDYFSATVTDSGAAWIIGDTITFSVDVDLGVTVSVTTDDYVGAGSSKIIRLALGSSLTSFEDIQVGSYISVTNASKEGNNIDDVRVTRVDPSFRWLEFENNDGQTDALLEVSVPTVTGAGDGIPTTPIPTDDAISEVWELTCVGTATSILTDTPVISQGIALTVGTGPVHSVSVKTPAVAETWTLECVSIELVYRAEDPVLTPIYKGSVSLPTILNQDLASEETFFLECLGGTTVFTAGTASKTAGPSSSNGTFEGPTAGLDAVAELWSMECLSAPKNYSKSSPISVGSGTGVIEYFEIPTGTTPDVGSWEAICTDSTEEIYIASQDEYWESARELDVQQSTTVTTIHWDTLTILREYDYFSGTAPHARIRIWFDDDFENAEVITITRWQYVYRQGIGFRANLATLDYDTAVTTLGTRLSTGATFALNGPSGYTGALISGSGQFVGSSFTIAISDGVVRWGVGDKFTFTISSETLGGATFSVEGADSGSQPQLTSGNTEADWYDNGFFAIRINDGSIKYEVGDIVQFTTAGAAGPNVEFSVDTIPTSGPGAYPNLTSGVAYSNDLFSVTVSDSTAFPWAGGDTITFDVVGDPQKGALFSVTGTVSNEQLSYPLTSGKEYDNPFFSIFVVDADLIADRWAVGNKIVFNFSAAAGDGLTFEVIGEVSRDQAYLTVGEDYSNDYFSMTIPQGAGTPWALNDKVFFKLTRTPQELVDDALKLFITRNYIQGNTDSNATYFTEGLQDSKFVFDADTAIPYTVSWVDPITQKLGLSSKYTGNNLEQATVTLKTDWPLFYSDSKNPHRIRAGSIIDVGDSITGLSSIGDNLLVFCKSSLWRIGIESLGAFPVLISDNIRCPAQHSIVKGEKVVAFYDGTGFSVTDGVSAVSVTAYKAKDYLAGINKAFEENIRGVYDRENKRFEFVFPNGDEIHNNYGMYLTEDTWNCYPFSRPDCNALWTNYYNGDLRVYHGTSGELSGGDGFVWRHDGDTDGSESEETTINSVSGQFIEVTSPTELSLAKGDTVTIYPSVSGGAYIQAIVDDVTQVTASTYIYSIEFLDAYDLTGLAAGDKVFIGFIPFDYGIKWTDFSSPQYPHQPRALHIDFEDMDGVLYVDQFKDMSDTPVSTDTYTPAPGESKIVVPYAQGKCYKFGFRLRGLTKTKFKINSFEIMFDTQA